MDIIPIIMAGGMGNRLWPLSNESIPKQFIKFNNNFSFFQDSLIRNKFLGKPIIVINHKHLNIVKQQISEVNIEAYLIIEPQSNDTAACALIATIKAKNLGFKQIIILAADHYILDNESYIQSIKENYQKFPNYILTIGITTNIPTSEYGYIYRGKQIGINLFQVKKFIEKPEMDKAIKFCINKNYFWNSGIFISNIDFILNKFSTLMPNLYLNIKNTFIDNNDISILDTNYYTNIEKISLDKAIIEKIPTDEIIMMHGQFDWQDMGNWQSISKLIQNNKDNNYFHGNIFSHNTNNSLILSNTKVIYTFGINNIIVINYNDALFIIDKSKIS